MSNQFPTLLCRQTQANRGDDSIADNDDKNDDEAIDDDYYCFICLLSANACPALCHLLYFQFKAWRESQHDCGVAGHSLMQG